MSGARGAAPSVTEAGPPERITARGAKSRTLSSLIAYGWIEQNSGAVPTARSGTVPQCYRVLPAGRRALKWARSTAADADDESAEAA